MTEMSGSQPSRPAAPDGGGWDKIQERLGEFQSSMQQFTQGEHAQEPRYYTGQNAIASLYGTTPTPGFFDQIQYLPMNANFYMPPGAGLPYMDPYGIMNPGALPPVMATSAPKKTVSKKERPKFCC